MGRRRAGDLSVNKKGTPLYSREDIREQYCINDKELQVLDKSGRRGILGCFSNNGQAGLSPCTSGGKGKKSILVSCIARAGSDDDLQEMAKRPISPGHRGTTWNGRNNGAGPYERHPDEDEAGFDEHYFRRRPKSVCMPNSADGRRYIPPSYGGLPISHLPPHNLGIPIDQQQLQQQQQQACPQTSTSQMTMAYGPHPLLRAATTPYVNAGPQGNVGLPATAYSAPMGYPVAPPTIPQAASSGGYTLPPTAAYFPVTAYSNNNVDNTQQVMMSQDSLNQPQPNTPDLLMHRRQVAGAATITDPSEISADERKQKHVSFDSSSLMRSQTLATMDEASFQRMMASHHQQNITSSPSKSSERLIDGRKTPDFELFSQIFPPELARQIMMDRMKRNSMRTQATQTDRNRHSAHITPSAQLQYQQQKIYMVSEGVQTNGLSRSSTSTASPDQAISPPVRNVRPPHSQQQHQQPPLPPYQDPPPAPSSPVKKKPAPPPKNISPFIASQLPGYKLQVYHIDGDTTSSNSQQVSSWYGTAPRSGKHSHHSHHGHHKHHSHSHHGKTGRSHSSGNVLEDTEMEAAAASVRQVKFHHKTTTHHHPVDKLQKSLSDGELLDDDDTKAQPCHTSNKSVKAVKFSPHPSQSNQSEKFSPHPSQSNQSEEEVSDRDLPELAPISQEDIVRKMLKKQNSSQSQGKSSDDTEEDLGKTLSPLGSTSSLQDLIESSSARASADPVPRGAWIERQRQKVSREEEEPIITNDPQIIENSCMLNSVVTNETSSVSTLAPEVLLKGTTSEQEEGELEDELEKLDHYLESPEREPEEEEKHASGVVEAQLKTNVDSGLPLNDIKQVKSPTHSLASSSSGSYSVNNNHNGNENGVVKKEATSSVEKKAIIVQQQQQTSLEVEPCGETPELQSSIAITSSSCDVADHHDDVIEQKVEDTQRAGNAVIEDQSPDASSTGLIRQSHPEPAPGCESVERAANVIMSPQIEGEDIKQRKQELKLELDVSTPPTMLNLPISLTSEDSTENSMIWQRIPMGSGDVRRKREAFEQQIKAISLDHGTGGGVTAAHKIAKKILCEEATPPGGLARSPAMHQGFRQEEWIVERTPVNTPDTANDKVVVAMINLSDEETSNHLDSDVVFRSSTAASTPQDGSMISSLGPSSVDLTQDHIQVPPKGSTSAPANLGDALTPEPQKHEDEPQVEVALVPPPAHIVEPPEPPAGFGDSPEHHRKTSQDLPGFHEAVSDQPLPQDELLMASEELETAPELHITEAFQPASEVVYSVKKESATENLFEAVVSTTSVSQEEPRKLSSTSSPASRPSTVMTSTVTSKNSRSRSRSSSKERLLSTLARSENAPQTSHEEDEVEGLYLGGYDRTAWAFIGKLSTISSQGHQEESKMVPLQRSESIESTQSEREFRKKYQAITHRMVHRKSSAVMYSRILERTFECNKTVRVLRVRGEFGFRIHGSRPVVVSAIEPATPAETSGLEVGDIILTINGVNVLDLPHTEVVKTAQTGCDELELGLARVQDLSTEQLRSLDPMNLAYVRLDDSLRILISGYLWKLSRSIMPTTSVGSASSLVSKWSRRFFVLRADSCLYFFKKEQDSRPLGATSVSGCVILSGGDEEEEGKPFTFRLKLASSSNSSATTAVLCLATDNQPDYDNWIHSIAHSAQTANKEQDDLWMEMSRQKMKMAPVDFVNVDCKGYLVKLDGVSKTWKKRFCVLSDAFLYLYTDQETEYALAAICLHGYRVQSTGSLGGNKKHTFELIPPDSSLKYFYFVADTETEKKRWLASLEYSIDRWMKLS